MHYMIYAIVKIHSNKFFSTTKKISFVEFFCQYIHQNYIKNIRKYYSTMLLRGLLCQLCNAKDINYDNNIIRINLKKYKCFI